MIPLIKLNEVVISYDKSTNDLCINLENREFNISGNSAEDIFFVAENCKKELSFEELTMKTGFHEEYLHEIINFLLDRKILSENYPIGNVDGEVYKYLKSSNTSYKSFTAIEKEIKGLKFKKVFILGNVALSKKVYEEIKYVFDTKIVDELKPRYDLPDLYLFVDGYEDINTFKKAQELAEVYNFKFLRVIIKEETLQIGPLFIPNETACYNCYLNRVLTNKDFPNLFLKYSKYLTGEVPFTEYQLDTLNLSSIYIKKQLINILANELDSELIDNEILYDFRDFENYKSKIKMVPNCKQCDKSSSKRGVYA